LPGIPIKTRYKPPRSAKSTVVFKNSWNSQKLFITYMKGILGL
jgi:hypothetical protein